MTSDIRKDLMEAAQGLTELNNANGVNAEQAGDRESPEQEIEETDIPQADVEGDVEDATDEEEVEATPEEEESSEPPPSQEDIPEPEQWVAEMRQRWGDIPADVRKYIVQREAQQHAYISKIGGQFAQMRKAFEDVDKALKPYDAEFAKFNVSRGQVVERLLAERGEMMKDPAGFIKRFADTNRISLTEIANDADMNEPPEVRQARWQLKDQESALEAQRQAVLQQQQQIEQAQFAQYIEGWGARKPHFQTVRQAMAQILPEIQQSYPYLTFEEQLEATYNAAMKHPNFANLNRPKPVPPQVRKAANGLSGASGVPTKAPEPNSIREALIQAAKETGYFSG